MDLQTWLNLVVAIVSLLGGWVLKMMHLSMRDLQRTDAALLSKLQAVELLVAGQYVRREDMDRMAVDLFRKLDRIENKLDGKADK